MMNVQISYKNNILSLPSHTIYIYCRGKVNSLAGYYMFWIKYMGAPGGHSATITDVRTAYPCREFRCGPWRSNIPYKSAGIKE